MITGITAKSTDTASLELAHQLGEELALYLIKQGADKVIADAKGTLGLEASADNNGKPDRSSSNGSKLV